MSKSIKFPRVNFERLFVGFFALVGLLFSIMVVYFIIFPGDIDESLDEFKLEDELEFNLDSSLIKDEIFSLINLEREERGLFELKRNVKLELIAQDYSERMLEEDFYSHTDPQGFNVYDRLQDQEIYYDTATENLDYLEVYSLGEVASSSVYGWIGSPGHSIPILNGDSNIWNNVGVGLSCSKVNGGDDFYTCISVLVFAGFSSEYVEEHLERGYVQMYALYPENYPYNYSTNVKLDFSATESMKIILTRTEEDFDNYIDRDKMEGNIWTKSTSKYSDTFEINKGYSVLVHATVKNTDYNLSIEYNV